MHPKCLELFLQGNNSYITFRWKKVLIRHIRQELLPVNHHSAKIQVIWSIEQSAIKLLILTLGGKNKLCGPEKF